MAKTSRKYEIGNVYRHDGTLFIAIASDVLVTYKDQKLVKRRPIVKYKQVKTISVDELCQKWGIDVDLLDQLMISVITPPQPKRTAPSGNRRRGGDTVTDEYYQLRLGRVLRA